MSLKKYHHPMKRQKKLIYIRFMKNKYPVHFPHIELSFLAEAREYYPVRPWVAVIFLPELACISGGNLRPNWVVSGGSFTGAIISVFDCYRHIRMIRIYPP